MAFSILEWDKKSLGFVAGVVVLIVLVSSFQLRIGQMKARDAQRKADVELVGRALDAYFIEHDDYPAAAGGKILACGGKAMKTCEWGGENLGDAEGTIYLNKLPVDPMSYSGRTYVYAVNDTRQKYRIYVALEYQNDPAIKSDLTSRCSENVQCNWYVGN